ncbi:unnamed protein product [Brassicogethes aeneus]|uniref:BTB domain-containing protein n=1 Tax=Brassicogethes aeneus TaxID=1431903 RepID=A0A9P0FBZ4_BRAAE|nr:unnamed protein product [Brassicogethes aeneus]
MSNQNFLNALTSLLTTVNPAELFKVLATIRKDVEWPKDKDNITRIREKKHLKHIVGALQSNQRNVLNVALSILGNCLLDKDCSRDAVGHYNILSHLNQLLKRFPKDDSIIGRIFRIVGNLCQHRDQWANTIIDRKPQIVTYIVNFVTKVSKDELPEDESFSEATTIMAIRALRCLLNSHTIMTLVKTFGVLRAIGALFIKYCIEWQKNKSHENLLINIIRLLQDYSRFRYYHSIMEMRSTERGDSLIYLSSVLLLAPKRVVKIVMNFIRICQLKSELPVPEIFDKFIEVLQKHSIVEELNDECVEYLQCLCYLLEHPANRNTERCGRCVPLLVKALKEFKEPTCTSLECCILLIGSLNKYKYDDKLMLEQVKANSVEILLEKIHWLVGSSKLNTDHKICRKRKMYSVTSPVWKHFGLTYGELLEPRSPSPSDEELEVFAKFERCPSPPSPCSSSNSDLREYACSWPSSSPKSVSRDFSDSDSDDYSPVCSDADVSDYEGNSLANDEEKTTEDVEKATEPAEHVEKQSNNCDNIIDKSTLTNLKIRLLTEIAKLLKTYIKIKPAVPQLASEDLLIALLKCSGCFDWQHHSNIDTIDLICRILQSHDYLITLMRTNFVETVYNLTLMTHASKCHKCLQFQQIGQMILTKLTILAESGVGKGNIAHQILRGEMDLKKQLVLVMPYIIRNKAILSKLLINCGGLKILLKLMTEPSETEEKRKSIKVLCALASRKLSIANPRSQMFAEAVNRIEADKYEEPLTCENLVTIKLTDGSTLKADRDFLSASSDFFGRLLNGYFKESSEDEILLQNVKLKPLRCLLNLMGIVEKKSSIDVDLDLKTLLDVIVLCDRYLMNDLCLSLSESIERNRLTHQTVPQIYQWSLESGTNILRVECIAYALVANLLDDLRLNMFESLIDLGYLEELVEDIKTLLTRFLSISDSFGDEEKKQKSLKVHLKRMKDNLLKNVHLLDT